ncbi:hypothetical protein MUB24_11815 [Lederbergia sp. NSJ-179]|uniref:hypothetical protein n=1 Tax=Lederbergia sp. NSJ-179 TaxID=2931402 RepID=UPI001FD3BA2C|nr:hypothetical protein [Lederbergia sp. NSJ-179]MCJ7841569.1 hypothetical protein [Lederbergia sp. NSJ-179]
MSGIIQSWVEKLEKEWDLADFELNNPTIRREVSPIQTTEYRLEMEWFPPGTAMKDDLNPPGTVFVEVNLNLGLLTSFIVVQNEDRRKNPSHLLSARLEDVVAWIKENTGLQSEVDFQLKREEHEGDGYEYFFSSILNGKKVSPEGYMEVKVNSEGAIVFFTMYGFFPKLYPEISVETSRERTLENVERFKNQQVVLFGTLEEGGYQLLYGVEEAFLGVVEDTMILEWREEEAIQEVPRSENHLGVLWENFRKSQIVTEEEMNAPISHPDALPISLDEKRGFLKRITDYMRAHRPNESGRWKVEKFERRYGLLEANVVPVSFLDRVLDKFKFIYDSKENMIVEVLDKRELFHEKMEFPVPQPKITKEEAIAILNKDIVFEPYYVYDTVEQVLKPTQMIDCHVFVDALTGERVFE